MHFSNNVYIDLPILINQAREITIKVKTNCVGEISVTASILIVGRFLKVPDNFDFLPMSLGCIKNDHKLYKDPISGRLFLCSTVFKEQLDN
jgi:hypothetical protein